MVRDVVAVGGVVPLEIVVVEVRVAEVADLALEAAGDEDVVERLESPPKGEAVALLF